MGRGGRSGNVLRAAWARGRGLVAFVLLSLVAGSAFLFVKQASSSLPPLTLVALRLSLGFMALFVLTAFFYRDYVPCMFTFKTALQLCFMAVANNVVPYTLYPIAQHYVDTGVAAILASTAPLFALVIGHFAIPVQPLQSRGARQGSERMTLLRALAVVVGLGGVVVLSLQKIGSKDGHSYWTFGAYFLVVLAAASKGCASVFAHRYLVDFKIIPLACGQTFFGSLIAISLSLIFDFNIPPFSFPTHYSFFYDLTWKAFWGVIYLGLAASCLAYLLQFYLLQTIGSVKQTFVDFLVPVVALVEGVVILDSWARVSDWYIVAEVVGACLILCSLGLAHGPSLCGPTSEETGHDSDKEEEEEDYSITFNTSPSASSEHITDHDSQPVRSPLPQPNGRLLLIP